MSAEPTLKISGNRTTTLRYQHYSGLPPATSGLFQSGFSRHEFTRLRVSGQAMETVKLEGEILQNDVDFDNKYMLKLSTKHYEILFGEFPLTFEGSEFTLYDRNLQGGRLTGEVPLSLGVAPRLEFTFVGSSPRGEAKYEKFFGTDTQGPYQLGNSPVVLESDQVLVNKQRQTRNVDYEINYLTGQITFKKRLVESKSLIEVTYEARQTVYPRSLYGGQVRYQFSEYDTFGIIGLDERDRKDQRVFAFSGVPATAHTIVGSTFEHDGEFTRFGGEYAHSFYDPNSFVKGIEHGNAYKGSLELERFGLLLGGNAKRVEPNYQTMGNTALGQDFLGWSGYGGLKVGRILNFRSQHDQQRTILDGLANRLATTDAKAVFSPKGWPRETYRFYQSDEAFESNFDRLERRHTADVTHRFKYLSVGSGYEHQEITFRDGSQPDRTWDAGKASLGVGGLSWLSTSFNSELRRGKESSSVFGGSQEFQTLILTSNIGFIPHKNYYLGGSNRWQQSTGETAQNTLRTEARAKPAKQLALEGNFSQETLQMFFAGEQKDAHTNSYATLAEVKPLRSISFLYQPSLRETVLSGVAFPINANRKEAYTARWTVGSLISTEGNFRVEDFRLRDVSDPGLRIQTSQDIDTWTASMRLAPTTAFSSDLNYTDKMSSKVQLNLSSPGLYDTRDTRQQIVQVGLKPQLEAKLGLNAGYRFEQFDQEGSQGPATSFPPFSISSLTEQITNFSLLNDYSDRQTYEHTAKAGASYQWDRSLISTANLTYDLKQDRLGLIPNTETLAAGSGLTFRIRVIKVNVSYRMAQSRGGASTRQQAFSGSVDFIPVSHVRWSTRGEYIVNDQPATAATDVTSSLEVRF